jgi:hypothetical protein
VDLVVLDQGIDTSTAVGRMFFQILGAIAEFDHSLMSERTRDGLDAACARGRTGGQKPKLTPRHLAYYTVPGNRAAVATFRFRVTRDWHGRSGVAASARAGCDADEPLARRRDHAALPIMT